MINEKVYSGAGTWIINDDRGFRVGSNWKLRNSCFSCSGENEKKERNDPITKKVCALILVVMAVYVETG